MLFMFNRYLLFEFTRAPDRLSQTSIIDPVEMSSPSVGKSSNTSRYCSPCKTWESLCFIALEVILVATEYMKAGKTKNVGKGENSGWFSYKNFRLTESFTVAPTILEINVSLDFEMKGNIENERKI